MKKLLEITDVSPVSGEIKNGENATITYKLNQPGDVFIYINSFFLETKFGLGAGTYDYTYQSLAKGEHELKLLFEYQGEIYGDSLDYIVEPDDFATLKYGYDYAGNLISTNINNEFEISNEYDLQARLKNVYSNVLYLNGEFVEAARKLEAFYDYYNDDKVDKENLVLIDRRVKEDEVLDKVIMPDKDTIIARNSITAYDVEIQETAEVIFAPGKRVTLKTGFKANYGAKFNAKLNTIPQAPQSAASSSSEQVYANTDFDKFVIAHTYDPVKGFLKTKTATYSKVTGGSVSDEEIFYEGLGYYYNGNISSQIIRNLGDRSSPWSNFALDFTYDELNRLTVAEDFFNSDNNSSYSYDEDGNLTQKIVGTETLNYEYDYYNYGSRLQDLRDELQNHIGSFEYDVKGRLTSDNFIGASLDDYNHHNLPLSITNNDGFTANYSYNENGERIYKKYRGVEEHYIRDYAGRVVAIYDPVTKNLKTVNLFGNGLIGKFDIEDNLAYYYAKDHLGSIRSVLDKDGNIVEATDYHPYGEELRGIVQGSYNPKYKLTEKERDSETNYDYFGARYYSSRLGRWLTPDPMSHFRPGLSPYNYVQNNPMNRIDPFGLTDEDPKDDYIETGYVLEEVVVTPDWESSSWFEVFRYVTGLYPNYHQYMIRDGNVYKRQIAPMPQYVQGIGPNISTRLPKPRPINFPSVNKITIDMTHVLNKHVSTGRIAIQSGIKSLFPTYMNSSTIEKSIKAAYKNAQKVRVQGDRVLLRGIDEVSNLEIEMWYNKVTKVIETAYPIFK